MEDFVPYDTVLKLEKKGYKGNTIRYHGHIYDILKWLRKTHNLFIVVFLNDDSDNPVTFEIYKGVECVTDYHIKYYPLDEWNKAEVDAIEYVIDNLI